MWRFLQELVFALRFPYVIEPKLAPLTPAQRWVMAANAQHARRNGERLDSLHSGHSPATEKWLLKEWWGCTDRTQVLATIEELSDGGHDAHFQQVRAAVAAHEAAGDLAAWTASLDGDERRQVEFVRACSSPNASLLGWDLVRVVQVARSAYVARYLTEAECWELLMPVGRRLQAAHGSWSELGAGFHRGRAFWGGHSADSDALYEETDSWLRDAADSPWRQLDWKTPL